MSVIEASGLLGRLAITPLTVADVPAFDLLGADPAVFQFVPQIQTPFEARPWVDNALANPENYIRHVVRIRATHSPIGYVQICRRLNCNLEFGYWLGRCHWGKGYGLEAACAALALFRAVGGGGNIFAAAFPANVASIRILARLGFRQLSEPEVGSNVAPGMRDHVARI